MTSPQPPSWAQALVSLFAPARGRDGVLGDLLEEYHEAQLPARGAAAANRWYVRQMLGFLLQTCLPSGLLASGILIGRDIYDLSLPTADFHTRAAVTTYASICVFALGGFAAARRSGRIVSGTACGAVAALSTCVIASAYALTAGRLLLNMASHARPDAYAALVETADLPIVPILVLGVLAASIGGGIGRLLTGSSGSRAAART